MADYSDQFDHLERWQADNPHWQHPDLPAVETSLGIDRTRWDLRQVDDRLPELDPPTGQLTPAGPSQAVRVGQHVAGALLWLLAVFLFLAVLASGALVVTGFVLLALVVLAGYASWPLAIVLVGLPSAALLVHALSKLRGSS